MMMQCDTCGNSKFSLIEEIGHMQTFKCDCCGALQHRRVYPAEELYDVPHFSVAIVWKDREVTVHDVDALRKLFPETSQIGVTEMLTKLRKERKWQAGRYSEFHVNELQKKAQELNLVLSLTEVK